MRSDAELAQTIRDEALLHILWLDPTMFRVAVSDGVATITGRVQRRSTAEMIAPTVSMVPGIVDVRAEVTWAVDDSHYKPGAHAVADSGRSDKARAAWPATAVTIASRRAGRLRPLWVRLPGPPGPDEALRGGVSMTHVLVVHHDLDLAGQEANSLRRFGYGGRQMQRANLKSLPRSSQDARVIWPNVPTCSSTTSGQAAAGGELGR